MKALQKYIHVSKYARFLDKEGRRETWEETVSRYIEFWLNRGTITEEIAEELKQAIIDMKVMPSMRCLMTAGKALEKDNAAGYNCWATAVNNQKVFDEFFYLLMCGGGVGFSVERQYIAQLPTISEEFHGTETVIIVRDSRIGWASALKELISLLYNGSIPSWDLSRIRPAGSRLKTFGGRASGPEPLDSLFKFCVRLFQNASGRKLNSIECHDLLCKIADTVIAGSVRRAASISFSNLTDDRMRRAKVGEWATMFPYRALANNAAAYTEKPDLDAFSKEWRSIYKSKSGERSIVNKVALKAKAISCGREHDGDYLMNPCGEAIIKDTGGSCNLTEVIIRPEDTLEMLKEKVRLATILGTIQSTLTDFRYLRKIWKDNAEEERLLGVSLTGIMDHPVMNGSVSNITDQERFTDFCGYFGLREDACGAYSDVRLERILLLLKDVARETNKEWADKLGINPSKQLTLIKPSGTVSLLTNTSSGIHPRFSPYYIRRVTQDINDPLTDFMIAAGIPYSQAGTKFYFEFPVKAPKESVSSDTMTALDQLKLWLVYREYWCDGNPSQTIYYTDDEYFAIADWVWKHWDSIGGLSFFPKTDHIYENAPIEPITEEEYTRRTSEFPEVNWLELSEYETKDTAKQSIELQCSGGNCEI